jgi:hypothetical protein
VVKLIPAEVPAPAELVIPYEALIADAVERSVGRRDADDRVCAALPCAPVQLPHVHALRVADLPSYAVRTLRDWVSVKGQFVIFLQEGRGLRLMGGLSGH